MGRLNVGDARCAALFASGLQRSDVPATETAAEAISRTVRRFGTRGCASRMAQESGDHLQAAAEWMPWSASSPELAARQAMTQPTDGGGDERDV